MNAGGRRTGLSRAGGSSSPSSAMEYVDEVSDRMYGLTSLTPETSTRISDPFTVGALADRWTVTVPAGGAVAQTATGATWGGGVAVIEQNSGAWANGQLLWKGPNVTPGLTTDIWAIAYRSNLYVQPAANAFNNGGVGVTGATKSLMFNYDESVSATKFWLGKFGVNLLTTTQAFASWHAAGLHELMLVMKPVAGTLTVFAYFDRVLVGQVAFGTNEPMRPIFFLNKGTVVVDDMVMIVAASQF